jgi:DNA repair photolyase
MKEEDWPEPKVRDKDVRKKHPKYDGQVMFPTTHDITPTVLEPCITVLENLLKPSNQVLIVSKPHLECIEAICERFQPYRKQILFRFTIGAFSDPILQIWEPCAPSYDERLSALMHAYNEGYATSVSCEPMLDSSNIVALFYHLVPFVTHSIWIGKMNRMEQRVKGVPEEEMERIRRGQTDERIKAIYRMLKDEPKVRWKESFKEVLGLEPQTEAGKDE